MNASGGSHSMKNQNNTSYTAGTIKSNSSKQQSNPNNVSSKSNKSIKYTAETTEGFLKKSNQNLYAETTYPSSVKFNQGTIETNVYMNTYQNTDSSRLNTVQEGAGVIGDTSRSLRSQNTLNKSQNTLNRSQHTQQTQKTQNNANSNNPNRSRQTDPQFQFQQQAPSTTSMNNKSSKQNKSSDNPLNMSQSNPNRSNNANNSLNRSLNRSLNKSANKSVNKSMNRSQNNVSSNTINKSQSTNKYASSNQRNSSSNKLNPNLTNNSSSKHANASHNNIQLNTENDRGDKLNRVDRNYATFGLDPENKSRSSSHFHKTSQNQPRNKSLSKSMTSSKGKEAPPKETSENYKAIFDDNVKTLQAMINDIRSKGFEKVSQEINDCVNFKNNVNTVITNMQKQLNFINSEARVREKNIQMFVNENLRLKNIEERVTREQYFIKQEVPLLKEDIERIEQDIETHSQSTRDQNSEMNEIDGELLSLKERIKKANKNLTDIVKERENIRSSIKIFKKHVETLREKISKKDQESKQFLGDVSIFLDKSIGEFNKSTMR